MNKVILMGKIVKDPMVRSKGAPCEITVMTRDEWKGERIEGKNNSEFHSVIIWGSKGDWAKDNLVKGDIVLIEGFLKHNKLEYKLKDKAGKAVIVDGEPVSIKVTRSEIKAKSIKKI